MVLGGGGTVPPPHISGPALYSIFSTVNTGKNIVNTLSCDEEHRPVAEFMCDSTVVYFVVHVRCRQESSRSLSHLLMSFLLFSPLYGLISRTLNCLRGVSNWENIILRIYIARHFFVLSLSFSFWCRIVRVNWLLSAIGLIIAFNILHQRFTGAALWRICWQLHRNWPDAIWICGDLTHSKAERIQLSLALVNTCKSRILGT